MIASTLHTDPDRDYAKAVEHEQAAWHALHACAPGSPERHRAWAAWSEAISQTNRAWRRLSASKAQRSDADPRGDGMGRLL